MESPQKESTRLAYQVARGGRWQNSESSPPTLQSQRGHLWETVTRTKETCTGTLTLTHRAFPTRPLAEGPRPPVRGGSRLYCPLPWYAGYRTALMRLTNL